MPAAGIYVVRLSSAIAQSHVRSQSYSKLSTAHARNKTMLSMQTTLNLRLDINIDESWSVTIVCIR